MNRKGILVDDANAVEIVRNVKPYTKSLLEITDRNRIYRQKGQLNVEVFRRGIAWLNSGPHDSHF
jgi:glucose-1-phosphate thymidylyltransferase